MRGIYSLQDGRNQFAEAKIVASFSNSIDQFQEAIRLDPSYAQAYAGLASAYHWLAGVRGPELAKKSRNAAEKALELDDNLGVAHGALGYVSLAYEWDLPQAEREMRRAIELNSNDAEAHHGYGLYFFAVGRPEDAIFELSRSRDLDPANLALQENLGLACSCAGQFDRAIGVFQSLLEIQPNTADFRRDLAEAFIARGDTVKGLTEARRAIELNSEYPNYWVDRVWGEAASGNRAAALKARATVEALARKKPGTILVLAEAHAALGENTLAFEMLQLAIDRHDHEAIYIKCDRMLQPLHDDPRFAVILRRLNLPQ